MLILLTVCGLLSTIFCVVAASTQHSAVVPSAQEMIIGVLFWPAFILSGIGLVDSVRRGRKSGTYFRVAALFVPMVLCGAYGIGSGHHHRQNEIKRGNVVETAGIINPLLLRYHELYPERFHYIGMDDEVAVAGFTDFARSQSSALANLAQVKDGQFLDPWGRKFYLALNRGKEADISVSGWKYPDQTGQGWVVATISLGADGRAGDVKVGNNNYFTYDDFAASN
jgi:hypothetical protein